MLQLQLRPCSAFHTRHEIGSRIRTSTTRSSEATILCSSSVEDALQLDPEAVQLKDELIALASATRRGVSRKQYRVQNNITYHFS